MRPDPESEDRPCEGFPFDCRNLIDVSGVTDPDSAFLCGCTEEDRARSRATRKPSVSRPDHRKHEERAALFPFVGAGLGEEDCPSFTAALDLYVSKVLRSEAGWLHSMPQPQQATGLRGPYWYGQGFREAADELEESADRLEPFG